MKIILDAGHRNTKNDFGATGNGLKESALALSIVEKLKKELDKLEVEVDLTRKSEDETLAVSKRAEKSKQLKGDVLVSVYINAATNTEASGIEVLYKSQKALATRI